MNNNKYSVKPDIKLVKSGNEGVLYGPSGEKIHVLNRTALFIWEGLSSNLTFADIEKNMREEFSLDEDVDLASDLLEIAEKFRSLDLLH